MVLAPPVYFGVSFVVFRWVLIEIELDLFVDYKTSFTFVLATDAVKSGKHYYAILIRVTRFASQRHQ